MVSRASQKNGYCDETRVESTVMGTSKIPRRRGTWIPQAAAGLKS
jgi:hypothetical protein